MTMHITHIEIDMAGMPAPTPEIEQERRVAIFDLLEENSFSLPAREDRAAPPGPNAFLPRLVFSAGRDPPLQHPRWSPAPPCTALTTPVS